MPLALLNSLKGKTDRKIESLQRENGGRIKKEVKDFTSGVRRLGFIVPKFVDVELSREDNEGVFLKGSVYAVRYRTTAKAEDFPSEHCLKTEIPLEKQTETIAGNLGDEKFLEYGLQIINNILGSVLGGNKIPQK